MFYCAGLKRRVSAEECEDNVTAGTKGCADDCPLRKEYGLYTATAGSSEAKKQTKAELEAAPLRKCNVCQNEKPLTPEFFKKRKHFALTCIECEGEPWNKKWNKKRPDYKKTKESIDASGSQAVENQEKPKPTPFLPPRKAPGLPREKKPTLDLSGIEWLKNGSRGPARQPEIRIQKHAVTFSAAAIKKWKKTINACQTIDIGILDRGGKKLVVLRPHNGMTGQYRIQRKEGRICVALDRKGHAVEYGGYPVEVVDGLFVAEVGA
jgi:hypothetical protein